MSDKYGFEGGGISLPKPPASKPSKSNLKKSSEDLKAAVEAGHELGFVNREPKEPKARSRKPGPKRKEPQDKISIPGPKRVILRFRSYCEKHNLTLWQGLEKLLEEQPD